MRKEQRSRFISAALGTGVALLSLLLIFFLPLKLSQPETAWIETNTTQTWTWNETQTYLRKDITIAFNVTVPGEPRDYDILPSLLTAETYDFPYKPDRPDPSGSGRGSTTWINLSLNGERIVQGRNGNGGTSTYEDHCGVPCSLDEVRYHHALREGTNEVRFDVSYVYEATSTLAVNVTARIGPVRVTLYEVDRDGDGVSDRYQLVPGIPALLTALVLGIPGGGAAYAGTRRIPWKRNP